MKVDFHIYSTVKKASANVERFLRICNWPIASPEKGWMITFALRGKDSTDSEQLKIGKVMHVAQTEESYAKVWVDMEEFTEKLQYGLLEAIGWRTASPPSSQ